MISSNRFRTIGGVVFGGLLAMGLSFGAQIQGTLVLSGQGPVAVNLNDIDFDYSGGTNATNPPTATGTVDGTGDSALFNILNTSTGDFLPLAGTTATVADLNSTDEPTGSTVSKTNFLTFSANGWSVTLTEVLNGNLPYCNGSTDSACTPFPGSPFDLIQNGNTVQASFTYIGTITNGTDVSPATGTFSTTFSGVTIDGNVLPIIAGGGAIVTSDSGTLFATTTSSVPEPATGAMIGGALLGLAALLKKVRKA
jgi:hypothetical protein